MPFPHRSMRARALLCVLAVCIAVIPAATGRSAHAGPAPGLCKADGLRGTVPKDFPVDACLGTDTLTIVNTLEMPVRIQTAGDAGKVSIVSLNQSLPAMLTRFHNSDPNVLLPGDHAVVAVGGGASQVGIVGDPSDDKFYLLAVTLDTYAPAGKALGIAKDTWGILADMITKISDDLDQYMNCQSGQNWIGRLGCRALLVRNVAYTITVAVAQGALKLGKNLISSTVDLLTSSGTYLKWVGAQVPAISAVVHGGSVRIAAKKASAAPSSAGHGSPSNPGPAPNPVVHLAQGPAAPSGYHYAVDLSGFGPSSSVNVTCFDSQSPSGFFTFSVRMAASGAGSTAECYSAAGPDHWVTANGVESNHVTWDAVPPPSSPTTQQPPPPPATTQQSPPAPQTYTEQESSHGVNTFTNYHNASGMGPRIAGGQYVQVTCKVYDPYITSVNPDGYWYRIATAPWNGIYYSPANTFMNGDPWGGPYSHPTDWSVPNC